MATRCKHPNAKVTELRWSTNCARLDCPDCALMLIAPREPWVSRHACRRVHRAPKWAQKLIDAAWMADNGALTVGVWER